MIIQFVRHQCLNLLEPVTHYWPIPQPRLQFVRHLILWKRKQASHSLLLAHLLHHPALQLRLLHRLVLHPVRQLLLLVLLLVRLVHLLVRLLHSASWSANPSCWSACRPTNPTSGPPAGPPTPPSGPPAGPPSGPSIRSSIQPTCWTSYVHLLAHQQPLHLIWMKCQIDLRACEVLT